MKLDYEFVSSMSSALEHRVHSVKKPPQDTPQIILQRSASLSSHKTVQMLPKGYVVSLLCQMVTYH